MKKLQIPQKIVYVYQKFTSWKTQRKYVNQTTATAFSFSPILIEYKGEKRTGMLTLIKDG